MSFLCLISLIKIPQIVFRFFCWKASAPVIFFCIASYVWNTVVSTPMPSPLAFYWAQSSLNTAS